MINVYPPPAAQLLNGNGVARRHVPAKLLGEI